MKFFDIEHKFYDKESSMYEQHSHGFYEFYYLVSGERDYFIGSDVYKIRGGTLVAIPPYAPHKTEGSVFNRYLVSFEMGFLEKQIVDNIIAKKVLVIDKNTSKKLESILEEIENEYKNKFYLYEDIIKANLIKFFSMALRWGKHIDKSDYFSIESYDKDDLITKIVLYINNNLADKVTLEHLAEKFYISKSHLSRKFKHIVKQNVAQYVLTARINYATKLLKTTKHSMQRIAEMTGFLSSNYMNYVFKKNLNISPTKYRENMS